MWTWGLVVATFGCSLPFVVVEVVLVVVAIVVVVVVVGAAVVAAAWPLGRLSQRPFVCPTQPLLLLFIVFSFQCPFSPLAALFLPPQHSPPRPSLCLLFCTSSQFAVLSSQFSILRCCHRAHARSNPFMLFLPQPQSQPHRLTNHRHNLWHCCGNYCHLPPCIHALLLLLHPIPQVEHFMRTLQYAYAHNKRAKVRNTCAKPIRKLQLTLFTLSLSLSHIPIHPLSFSLFLSCRQLGIPSTGIVSGWLQCSHQQGKYSNIHA